MMLSLRVFLSGRNETLRTKHKIISDSFCDPTVLSLRSRRTRVRQRASVEEPECLRQQVYQRLTLPKLGCRSSRPLIAAKLTKKHAPITEEDRRAIDSSDVSRTRAVVPSLLFECKKEIQRMEGDRQWQCSAGLGPVGCSLRILA